MILLIIYLIGCLLCFGRFNATFDPTSIKEIGILGLIIILSSWVGFFVGILTFLLNKPIYKNKQFMKFDIKGNYPFRQISNVSKEKTKAEIREEKINKLLKRF